MTKTTLHVEGMSCPSCIDHVAQALALEGVAKVDVQIDDGAVEIEQRSNRPATKPGHVPRDRSGNV